VVSRDIEGPAELIATLRGYGDWHPMPARPGLLSRLCRLLRG
jgi:hypothetical protein